MTAQHPHPDRAFDKTSLHEDVHGQAVHRDYLAHAFRWGFITHRLINRETRVLDIGCGVDTPLAKVITMSKSLIPAAYVGVDFNKEPKKVFKAKWASFSWDYNFCERWPDLALTDGPFDVIVNLEVVEHMRPDSVLQLLEGARECLADDGTFVLSTPVYNGKKMANNHINEMTVETLRDILTQSKLRVVDRFGTFMSYNEVAKCASPEEIKVHAMLRKYYSDEVLACFLAPLHPDNARNNIWILKKG